MPSTPVTTTTTTVSVRLHLALTLDEVIIAAIDLVVASRARRVRNAAAKRVRVLRDEIVVDAVFYHAEDDDGSRGLHVFLNDNLFRYHRVFRIRNRCRRRVAVNRRQLRLRS